MHSQSFKDRNGISLWLLILIIVIISGIKYYYNNYNDRKEAQEALEMEQAKIEQERLWENIYIGSDGNYYHMSFACANIGDEYDDQVDVEQAEALGLEPCPECATALTPENYYKLHRADK